MTLSHSQAAHHHRISISSTISPAFRGSYLPPNRLVQEPIHSPRYHPAPSRNEIAIVQPVLVRLLHHTSYQLKYIA